MNQNTKIAAHDDTLDDLFSFLTEFAQIQRAVGNHERANRAEVIRNTFYQQAPHVI